jgi:solute carrier family 25 carnitine/acylcarnitine transporter 20/29
MAQQNGTPGAADKAHPSSGLLVFRRVVGGTVGGFFQAVCSHPFDTIKSRIQAGVSPSVTACVRDTYAREGVLGFYKGVLPPMATCGIYNAVLFSANQAARNLVRPRDAPPGADLSLPRVALAGICAAPFAVAVLTPAEVVKVRLQLQTQHASKAQYSGVVDCIRKTAQREGITALYNGYFTLVASRVIGLPFYFIGFELTKRYMQGEPEPGKPAAPTSSRTALMAGTNAGFGFWSACYPCDFVKTKLQMAPKGSTSATKVIKETLSASGPLGLYSGYGACMLRSAPANASVWFAMENTIRLMAENGM